MGRIRLFTSYYWPLFFGLFLCTLSSCVEQKANIESSDEVEQLQQVVEDYITTYQAREDWEKMLSFYSDTVYFLDVNLKIELDTKTGFMEFYDWANPNFSKFSSDQKTFLVEDLIVNGRTATIKGRFQPFYWQGDLKEWTDLFTIWLHFNENDKIIRQYDFIKYPKQFLPE